MDRIGDIAGALREASLDGWLFYDFRMSDPLAYRILGIPENGLTTRRWFCFIPADGAPVAIVSAVEAHRLDALPFPGRIVYRSEREMMAALAGLLKGRHRIAMNYSSNCAIPYVSRDYRTGAFVGCRSCHRCGFDSSLRSHPYDLPACGPSARRRSLTGNRAGRFR
jgi:hypothetical protein